jgi:hypothetical protein
MAAIHPSCHLGADTMFQRNIARSHTNSPSTIEQPGSNLVSSNETAQANRVVIVVAFGRTRENGTPKTYGGHVV